MVLHRVFPVELVVQFNYVGIRSVPFELIPSAIETEDKLPWSMRAIFSCLVNRVRHGVWCRGSGKVARWD